MLLTVLTVGAREIGGHATCGTDAAFPSLFLIEVPEQQRKRTPTTDPGGRNPKGNDPGNTYPGNTDCLKCYDPGQKDESQQHEHDLRHPESDAMPGPRPVSNLPPVPGKDAIQWSSERFQFL